MKVLVLSSEAWNDRVNPNNNLSNWFSGMEEMEFASVYGSPDLPYNHQCKYYFQNSETMMVKSLTSSVCAGKVFKYTEYPDEMQSELSAKNLQPEKEQKLYSFFKSHSNEFVRLIRDMIWNTGRYDLNKLKTFITDFSPDVVFTQRMGSIKMCRLEQIVHSITDAPFVAYTGDDEYSLKQISYSPFYWVRRLWLRSKLKKNYPFYRLFYSMSYNQMAEFEKEFGSKTKLLVKSGVFSEEKIHKEIGSPIRMVYVGKMYCNRWKTLALLADCIKTVNIAGNSGPKFILEIYTKDDLSERQKKALHDGMNSFVMGPIKPQDIPLLYEKSDIVLHVEGLDKRNRFLTKYSFSTKVMDCLSSGCAVLVVSWEKHSACEYLHDRDAAFTASDKESLTTVLEQISADPNLIINYAHKAYQCGKLFHQKSEVQRMIKDDFQKVIEARKYQIRRP